MFSHTRKIISQNWLVDVEFTITSQVAIHEDSVIFGTQNGELICLDKEGNIQWKYEAIKKLNQKEALFLDQEDATSILCTPLIEEDKIYFGTESGEFHCITTQGTFLWKQALDGAIRGTPTIALNKTTNTPQIIAGTIDGSIYFLDLKGVIKKIIKIHSSIETNILLVDDIIFVGCGDGKIIACNQKGLHLWTYQTKSKITANLKVSELFSDGEKTLLIGSNDNNLYVLTLDGELKWKFETKGAIINAPITAHLSSNESRDIIVGSCDNNVYCINAHGEKLWSYETDFWVMASPSVINTNGYNRICMGSFDQKLYVLDGESEISLNFIPGLSGIINQTGYTSMATTRDVGENQAKKLYEQELGGHITSCIHIPNSQRLIVTTKQGKMYDFSLR